MTRASEIRYVLELDSGDGVGEYETLDEACDAVVLQFPLGAGFRISRVDERRRSELILQATRSTTRQRFQAS